MRKIDLGHHVPPGKNRFNFLLTPYRSYVTVVKLKSQPTTLGQTADLYVPYHYFRYHRSGNEDYLIAGGFDYKTGAEEETEGRFDDLQKMVEKYFPHQEFVAKWSSQYYESADGLPYIGLVPK